MIQQQERETEFRRRLRAELTTVVAQRSAELESQAGVSAAPTAVPWRRRAPRLGLAAATATAVAAAVLVVSAGGDHTPAAFAVETRAEGSVRVKIGSLEDAKGLEHALAEKGIPAAVTYLRAYMTCKEPRFQPVTWPRGDRVIVKELKSGSVLFSVSSGAVGPGQRLVITASRRYVAHNLNPADDARQSVIGVKVGLAGGAVGPCEPMPLKSGMARLQAAVRD